MARTLVANISLKCSSSSSPLGNLLEFVNDEAIVRRSLQNGMQVNQVDSYGRTPLLIYLQREDCSVGIVEVLLDSKANVNRKDIYGDSPLAAAMRNSKDNAVIRLLIERGAEVNSFRNLHNTNPLIVLLRESKNCSVDAVKLLLAKGADINCVDKDGDSPLVTALKVSRDEAIIQALLEGGANVNMVCKYGESPLNFYLKSYNCSVAIVKLLLHYKADVNSMSTSENSPLLTALKKSRDVAVIQALLEGGAYVNTLDAIRRSPLCIAFRHSSSDIVKMLLNAGALPSRCKYHTSALCCATKFSHSGLREDILKLLLRTNVKINKFVSYKKSFMCFALQNGARPHDIRLLLASGASLNICKLHSSPLGCATGCLHTPLREDVVQLLLGYESYVGDKSLKVLQQALRYCNYETGAIQLLLDLPGVDAYVGAKKSNSLLLHAAIENPYCRLDAIKLLVKPKMQVVFKAKHFGQTVLHRAVRNKTCEPNVVNFLLQNGSPVNATNKFDETPLMVAVQQQRPANILKDLLIAGAHIGKAKFRHWDCLFKYELLEFLARQWEGCSDRKTLDSYRMLVKFFLLQNPKFDIGDFERDPAVISWYKNKLLIFMNECLSELEKMDSIQVSHEHTLRMFVSRDCLFVENIYDLDKIFLCLIKKTFPIYSDVISARIGRSIMEAQVKRTQVYTNKLRPDLLYVERVRLNCDIVHKISQYLPDDDLLNFVLASYKPVKQNNSGGANKNDTLLGKRNSETSSKLHKRPKLFR